MTPGPWALVRRNNLVLDRGDEPSRRLEQTELAGVIQQALETLHPRQRLALVLNKFEEMNYNEIAEAMSITTKAVKSLLCRGRENLREALKDYISQDDDVSVAGGSKK